MFLKRISISGFKSYTNEVTLTDLRTFNAITGLNGSGKSNILDAIIFALNLDNPLLLRAKKIEDLINKSSTTAVVTLEFSRRGVPTSVCPHEPVYDDHQVGKKRRLDEQVFVDEIWPVGYDMYDTLTVMRSVSRHGKSKMQLNGHPCTTSTIKKLFTTCNISKNASNIIMQGRITTLLNKCFKTIIEETAGIKQFEEEKIKALNVIESKEEKFMGAKNMLYLSVEPFIHKLREERHVYLEKVRCERNLKENEKMVCDVNRFLNINDVVECSVAIKSNLKEYDEVEKEFNVVDNDLKDFNTVDERVYEIEKMIDENELKLGKIQDQIKVAQDQKQVYENKLKEESSCEDENKIPLLKEKINILKEKEIFLLGEIKANEKIVSGVQSQGIFLVEKLEDLEKMKIEKNENEEKIKENILKINQMKETEGHVKNIKDETKINQSKENEDIQNAIDEYILKINQMKESKDCGKQEITPNNAKDDIKDEIKYCSKQEITPDNVKEYPQDESKNCGKQEITPNNAKEDLKDESKYCGKQEITPNNAKDDIKDESKYCSKQQTTPNNAKDEIKYRAKQETMSYNAKELYKNIIDKLTLKLKEYKEKIVSKHEIDNLTTTFYEMKRKLNYPLMNGVFGTVYENFTLKDKKYSTPIKNMLGPRLNYIIVDNERTGSIVINERSLNKSSKRINVIPLNKIKSYPLNKKDKAIRERGGVRGIDSILFENEMKKAFEYICGNFYIFERPEDARRACFEFNVICVSLCGNVYDPRGVITGGKSREYNYCNIKRKDVIEINRKVKEMESSYKLNVKNQNGIDMIEKFMAHIKDLDNCCKKSEILVNKIDFVESHLKNKDSENNQNILNEVRNQIKENDEKRKKILKNLENKSILNDKITEIEREINEFVKEKTSSEEILKKEKSKLEILEIKRGKKEFYENEKNILETKKEILIKRIENSKIKVKKSFEKMKNKIENNYKNKEKDLINELKKWKRDKTYEFLINKTKTEENLGRNSCKTKNNENYNIENIYNLKNNENLGRNSCKTKNNENCNIENIYNYKNNENLKENSYKTDESPINNLKNDENVGRNSYKTDESPINNLKNDENVGRNSYKTDESPINNLKNDENVGRNSYKTDESLINNLKNDENVGRNSYKTDESLINNLKNDENIDGNSGRENSSSEDSDIDNQDSMISYEFQNLLIENNRSILKIKNISPLDSSQIYNLKTMMITAKQEINTLKKINTSNMDPKNFDLLEKNEENIKLLENKIKRLENDKSKLKNSLNQFSKIGKEAFEKAYIHLNKYTAIFLSYFIKDSDIKIDPQTFELSVKIMGSWKNSMNELSGGQKSIVALSVIFAMLKFNPAPFYLFDEIDSALDLSFTQAIGEVIKNEFNVQNKAQFIVVSLKDGMYGNADAIYKVCQNEGKNDVEKIK